MNEKKSLFRICFETNIAALCLIVMTVLLFLGVVSRFTKLFVISFTEELVLQLFLVMSMFAIAECVYDRTLMGLSVITDTLHGKAKIAVLVFDYVITVAMFLFLLWQGCLMVLSQYRYDLVTSVLQMKKWWFTMAFPIGSVLFIIRATIMLVDDIREELRR